MQPYDPKYLEENKIKHMSFHAYLRKLIAQNKTQSGKPLGPLLVEPNYSVDLSCPNHAPFPEGLCSGCQPSAIVLQPQVRSLL